MIKPLRQKADEDLPHVLYLDGKRQQRLKSRLVAELNGPKHKHSFFFCYLVNTPKMPKDLLK